MKKQAKPIDKTMKTRLGGRGAIAMKRGGADLRGTGGGGAITMKKPRQIIDRRKKNKPTP